MYNYLSKDHLSSQEGNAFASTAIFPEEQDLLGYEYGSMYYIPRGNSDGIKIDSVDFRYYVPSIGGHLSGNALANGIKPLSSSRSIDLEIYPNPAQDFVTVQADFESLEAVQYLLTDIHGRIIQIQKQQNAKSLQHFNLKKLPAGTYFIQAQNKTEAATATFVKK